MTNNNWIRIHVFRKNFGSNKIVVITVGSKKKTSNPKKLMGVLWSWVSKQCLEVRGDNSQGATYADWAQRQKQKGLSFHLRSSLSFRLSSFFFLLGCLLLGRLFEVVFIFWGHLLVMSTIPLNKLQTDRKTGRQTRPRIESHWRSD